MSLKLAYFVNKLYAYLYVHDLFIKLMTKKIGISSVIVLSPVAGTNKRALHESQSFFAVSTPLIRAV